MLVGKIHAEGYNREVNSGSVKKVIVLPGHTVKTCGILNTVDYSA